MRLAGGEPVALWHGDADLRGVDAVVLPGGFSYGDHLRAGAIARFAPAMTSVVDAAKGGMPVLGICNGFQVLCESHLLPGALTRNSTCTSSTATSGCASRRRTPPGRADLPAEEIVVPVKNGEGSYVADERTLDALEAEGRVVAYYAGGNPNGSLRDIAAISNERGNVVGVMPHPEHAVEDLTGPGTDGLGLLHLRAHGAGVTA